MTKDLQVYVITTTVPHLGRDHFAIAEAALRGGATVLQFRDKTLPNPEFTAAASRLVQLSHAAGVPLIINDRVEVAVAVKADGVHLGQQDTNARDARRALPSDMLLGISATTYAEALAAREAGADYLGVGPIFATPSKADAAPPIGLGELARICRDAHIPVVAIGGIVPANLRSVIEAGVAGAAVIAAVAEAPDMVAATAHLKSIWQSCTARRP